MMYDVMCVQEIPDELLPIEPFSLRRSQNARKIVPDTPYVMCFMMYMMRFMMHLVLFMMYLMFYDMNWIII